MKFGDKLFFATTVVLTIIFAVFGIWMLSSYFQKNLNREIEQGNTESRMYQYLFEMAYQSVQEYGYDYAVARAIESVVNNVEKEGVNCFVMTPQGDFLYGEPKEEREEAIAVIHSMLNELSDENTYVYGIRKIQGGYYLIHICSSITAGGSQYLGLIRDLTDIFEDRSSLLNQYRLALVCLLLIGGVSIYILSRLITQPIRNLSAVAGNIAAGNYQERSHYDKSDEIGELADSFNRMADKLVKQMQEKEHEARQKELEARQKEDFTAAFAHELKTPLTSIIGYADMLGTVPLSDEERQEAYFYIYSQGKRLESLSHKLLDLVSLNKHPLSSREIPSDLLEENIRTTMRPIFKSKRIKSKIDMEKGVILGDYELLLTVFYNLLDNAVKAVDEDGFILFKGTKQENGYEIKVVDNGRGIPEQEIERITEAFYMVDKSRSRKEGGAGIGMTLCKQIITLHNGVMRIKSKPGEGTVVQLFFCGKQQNTAVKTSGME